MRAQFAVVFLAALAVSVVAQTEVKWCVPYDQPQSYADLCTQVLAAANTDAVTFTCVPGGSPEECMDMIAKGDAHLTTFDGGDMYAANAAKGLTPLLFENYGYGVGTSYYAVAAVKKDFCNALTTLGSLKGKNACHTGYRKTAGWYSPVSALLRAGVLQVTSDDEGVQDDAESIAATFDKVCAPRTTSDGPKVGGEKWDQLCTGCQQDCTTQDKYYDYQGAFRCMMEGSGDVAFIKHTTIPDYAVGGKKAEDWATDGSDAFMLLCPSGGCKSVDEYEECHLAKVPAHAVIGPPAFLPTGDQSDLGKAIQDALVAAAEKEGFLESTIQLGDQKNFVFKSGTVGLDAVTVSFEEAVPPGDESPFTAADILESVVAADGGK